jgi:hypothetical protein
MSKPKGLPAAEEELATPEPEDEGKGAETEFNRFQRHERERVQFTTRIPRELFFKLKALAIRSNLQILTEHAYTLYIGTRLPPDLWGGYEWYDECSNTPKPEHTSGSTRLFSVRVPRILLRSAQVWAVQAEISDQELATRVFEWYVTIGRVPPPKEDARWDGLGRLQVDGNLVSSRFNRRTSRQIRYALDEIVENHRTFGGPLG